MLDLIMICLGKAHFNFIHEILYSALIDKVKNISED